MLTRECILDYVRVCVDFVVASRYIIIPCELKYQMCSMLCVGVCMLVCVFVCVCVSSRVSHVYYEGLT